MAASHPTRTLTEADTLVGPPSPRTAPDTGHPRSIGPYQVRRLIGEGGIGRVYRATDPRSLRDLAVKQIKAPGRRDGALMKRFLREAEAVRQLSHRGLVAIHAAGDDYIAMDLVRGESLQRRLERRGLLPPAEALAILDEVAEALDYIHSRGIVHRDVKPSNLLLPAGGGVKLTDFGIAHFSWAPMTYWGEVLGTPAYMAPEQIAARRVRPASDVYALGVVAFEMLTGRRPFRTGTGSELLLRVSYGPAPSARALNAALPAAVDAVLARALARDPARRFAGASEFVAALGAAAFPSSWAIRSALWRALRWIREQAERLARV
jgi:serine/threonine-protein kinase